MNLDHVYLKIFNWIIIFSRLYLFANINLEYFGNIFS
jgi:hypothetical protein